MPAPDANLRDDLALIEEAVRKAGAIARKFYQGEYKRWDKDKGQPVTEADLAVDKYLRETLIAARPDYGWLSEETEDDPARLDKKRVFVVDPIDGTVAFLKGRPHFTICVAVVCDGEAIVGVVYNPILDECFAAFKGGGAVLNGKPMHISMRAELKGCRMLGDKTMFLHPAWSNPPNTPWPQMEIETRNSVAYRMVLVASGAFDATLALSAKHDWDTAAADIIVREAGGILTAHTGTQLRYNAANPIQQTFICAGPALHAALLAKLKDLKLPR